MPARIVPAVSAETIRHDSERLVYESLRDHLTKSYYVFHSYPWLRPERGRAGALLEGEADFVILHPDLGLLVLEVKGGTPVLRNRQWFRKTGQGEVELKDPFEQARRSMHMLCKEVVERTRGRLRATDFVSGYAVVFPHCEYLGPLPPNAEHAIVLTQRHLVAMRDAIDEAFRCWTDRPRPLDQTRFACLLEALTPETKFYRPLGLETDRAREQLMMLTETQAEVVSAQLEARPRLLVEGPAGSGKTELALMQAVRFAKSGRRTLLVCFNRELARWLSERVERDPACRSLPEGRLKVYNYHRLVAEYVKQAGMRWPGSDGALTQGFWDDEAPDLLGQAVGVLGAESARFDAIIVDEAQDFRFGWWYSILEDLSASEDTPLQAFLDSKQCLWGEPERPPAVGFDEPLRLDTNCRNTIRVAEFSSQAFAVPAKTFRFAPEGRKAKIYAAKDKAEQRDIVLRRTKRFLDEGLTPDRIVLLGPSSKERGSLAEVERVGGVALTTSTAEWRDGNAVLVTTARKFKGLEADAVIVFDLGGLTEGFSEADLYVACTRAVYWLELIVHDEEVRRRLREALEGQAQ